jgi:hypothetical protein
MHGKKGVPKLGIDQLTGIGFLVILLQRSDDLGVLDEL